MACASAAAFARASRIVSGAKMSDPQSVAMASSSTESPVPPLPVLQRKTKNCQHDRRRDKCPICNACQHSCLEFSCSICNGCQHGRRKYQCRICNGCPHNRRKGFCRDCNHYTRQVDGCVYKGHRFTSKYALKQHTSLKCPIPKNKGMAWPYGAVIILGRQLLPQRLATQAASARYCDSEGLTAD